MFRLGGPPLGGWFGARGQGWAFGDGLTYFGLWANPKAEQTEQAVDYSSPRSGLQPSPTEVSALPRVHLHLDPIFVGSHNSILGARRSP
jgi:hypothetical protein